MEGFANWQGSGWRIKNFKDKERFLTCVRNDGGLFEMPAVQNDRQRGM